MATIPERHRSEIETDDGILYVNGEAGLLDGTLVCVTGSRRTTPYGRVLASHCGEVIAERGVTLLVGGSLGCEEDAARAALQAGGKVVIYAAFGADVVYPHKNFDIFERATVISNHPWGTPVQMHAFNPRNVAMGNLAELTVICEAAMLSGTMRVAEASKNVWAFPGDIIRGTSAGGNELIATGAASMLLSLGGFTNDFDQFLSEMN